MIDVGYEDTIATSSNACSINERNPQLNSKKEDLKLAAFLLLMPFFTFIFAYLERLIFLSL
jgi:hypothetical protein